MPQSWLIPLIERPSRKQARRIFPISSTLSIPASFFRIIERSVDTFECGSALNADHTPERFTFACRFTGGKDAEAMTRMIGRQKRQEFPDQLLAMLRPQDWEAGFPRQRKIAMRLSKQQPFNRSEVRLLSEGG